MISVPEYVKELYKQRRANSNLAITFPYSTHEPIDNSSIKKESFSFTESMCSRDSLKLGLCEVYEVQLEALCDDIKGKTIDVAFEVDAAGQHISIPFGRYIVYSCDIEDYKIGMRKIVAYSILYENFVSAQFSRDYISNPVYLEGLFKAMSNDKTGITQTVTDLRESTTALGAVDGFLGHRRAGTNPSDTLQGKISVYSVGTTTYTIPDPSAYYFTVSNIVDETTLDEQLASYTQSAESFVKGVYTYGFTINESVTAKVKEIILADIERLKDRVNKVEYTNYSFIEPFPCGYTLVISARTLGTQSRPYSITDLNEQKYVTATGPAFFYGNGVNVTIKQAALEDKDFKRKFFESFIELLGKSGRINRTTKQFEQIRLSEVNGLTPSESLVPRGVLSPFGGGLTPAGTAVEVITNPYIEDINAIGDLTQEYGIVSAIYYTGEGEEYKHEYRHYIVENANESTYQTYDLTNNWIFQNTIFENDTKIIEYCENVAAGLEGIKYTPINIDISAMPWLEAGDLVEIQTQGKSYFTYVLERQLKGIKNVTDNISSN